jgi:segregation and condensation protein A
MYHVKLSKFEGPLDLLLKLIEKEKLDITEISLVHITDAFIAFLKENQNISFDELVDFLDVFTRLLLLKSRLLMPSEIIDEEGDSLVDQLKIYRHYYLASKTIWKLFSRPISGFARRRIPEYLLRNFHFEVDISVYDLKRGFLKVINEFYPPQEIKIISGKRVTLKEKILELINLVQEAQEVELANIFLNRCRNEKVMIFLALLHLLKERQLDVQQNNIFGSILIQKTVSSDQPNIK